MAEILRWEEKQSLLKSLPVEDWKRIIWLEPHSVYPVYFLVRCLDDIYIHDLKEIIGPYRAVHMFRIERLWQEAQKQGYRYLVYIQTPDELLDRLTHADDPYPLDLGTNLYRFQTQGFNLFKDSHAQIFNWSAGTGKSVLAVAMAKYLLHTNQVDKVIVASRANNKIGWQRQFKEIGDMDAVIARAPGKDVEIQRARRAQIYQDNQIVIVNYEKFRFRNRYDDSLRRWVRNSRDGDGEEILKALKKKRVHFIWDEMPAKMSSMKTLHYKGARKLLNKTGVADAWHTLLSGTPIEKDPEGVYSCLKIVKPDKFKTKQEFKQNYARRFGDAYEWQVATWDIEKLAEMGMRLSDITHKADKHRDPEIRSQFPEEHWDNIYLDLSSSEEEIYRWFADKPNEQNGDALTKLFHLQVVCNNPAWLQYANSALAQYAYKHFKPKEMEASKIQKLGEIYEGIDAKILTFTMYRELGSQQLSRILNEWSIPHVLYDGHQDAIDRFQSEDQIKVFVSSDMGSDSINLPAGTAVVNYDLPWNSARLTQRVNRVSRINSKAFHGLKPEDPLHVFFMNLLMARTMEEKKLKLLKKKQRLEEAIFSGDIAEASLIAASSNTEDLLYMLSGSI